MDPLRRPNGTVQRFSTLARSLRPSLGPVDGFDQDEAAGEREQRSEVLCRLLASQRDAFEPLELADRPLDPRTVVVWARSGPGGNRANGTHDNSAAR